MKNKTYFEKLKDPRWQKKRLEALDNAEWQCELCCDSEETLHVHHKTYFKGREPWEYDTDQLAVLCEVCHEGVHEEDSLMEAVSRIPIGGITTRYYFTYLIAGALGLEFPIESWLERLAYDQGRELLDDIDQRYRAMKRDEDKKEAITNG